MEQTIMLQFFKISNMKSRWLIILFILFFVQLTNAQIAPLGFMNKPTINDPYFANVVLLMPMEINFTDVKAHAVTSSGSPAISASNIPAPYGTKCGSFGINNYVFFADSPDWVLTQTHTFECWVKPTATDLDANIHTFILQRDGPSSGYQWGYYNGKIFHWAGSGSTVFGPGTAGTPTITAGVAYHFAAVYDAASATEKIRVYINGVKVLTLSSQPTLLNYTTALAIGGDNQGYGQSFYGTLKDVRITKGIARYNANFTPPTTFYPTQ